MRATGRPSLASLAAAAILSLILGSCDKGDAGTTGGWTTVVGDRDGVRTVENVPPREGPAATMVGEELLRIGTFEGRSPSAFGLIRSLAVLPDGRIAVADGQAEEVRLFSARGEFVRSFGGAGQGPGELERLQGVYEQDGLLRVPEQGNSRVSVFDPDAGYLRSYPLRLYSFGGVGPWQAVVDSAGRTIVNSSGEFGEGRYWNMLRIYDESMVQLDSVPYFDYTDEIDVPGAWTVDLGPGRWTYAPVPFFSRSYEALTPSGQLLKSTEGVVYLEVTRWRPPEDTVLVFSSLRPTEPVTRAERDSALADLRRTLEERTGTVPGFDPSRVPDRKPPLHGLSTDDRGRVWVRLSAPEVEPTLYDVFGPDGTWVETVSIGSRVDPWVPPLVRGEEFWAVVVDELDVQYVVSGRLRPVD